MDMRKAASDSGEDSGRNVGGGDSRPRQVLFDPREEHDACGVGFIARLDGRPEHQVARDALHALTRLAHRGSRGRDGKTGDGAGILFPLPERFFRRVFGELGTDLPAVWALGQFFISRDPVKGPYARRLVEETLKAEGLVPLCWREAPVDSEALGAAAFESMPDIRQLLVVPAGENGSASGDDWERRLYVARRMLEKKARDAFPDDPDALYPVSLSSRSVIYKGMVAGSMLADFYRDLRCTDLAVPFAVFHERFSTNTRPAWRLAQPFRYLAHNGEINTLRGNATRMSVREPLLASPLFGERATDLLPVLDSGESDSAHLDRTLELLFQGGRGLAHSMMMLVPEPFGNAFVMGEDKRAFYGYHAAIMEPWDGPSALVFTDGARRVGAMLDRNGLRPARYTVTRDGLVILASEAGVLDIPADRILQRGRLQPRRMLMADLERHRLISDAEIKNAIIHSQPYRRWLHEGQVTMAGLHCGACLLPPASPLPVRERAHGYTQEEIRFILRPMAANAQEPVGSMGNDAAPAAMSERPQLLFHYFRQRFAQVTNPPIDPLREELVMSLMTFSGRQKNLLEETPDHVRRLRLPHPVLTPEEVGRLRGSRHPDVQVAELSATYPLPGTGKELEERLQSLFREAEDAIAKGATFILLSDRLMDAKRPPVPSLLAVSGLHRHLCRKGLRHSCGIVAEAGDAREVIHIAQLLSFGADAVCPATAFEIVRELAREGQLGTGKTEEEADAGYVAALRKGLLKTMARLGIATLRGFWGTQAFEALGVGRELVDRYFTGTATRINGIGIEDVALETRARHAAAFAGATDGESPEGSTAGGEKPEARPPLEQGGDYRYRSDGESRQWTPEAVRLFHKAVRAENGEADFRAFVRLIDECNSARATLRGLLRPRGCGRALALEEVEPARNIMRRFVGAAMSLGSISPEAHEAVAVALNRVGGRSNSGEGGEDPARAKPDARNRDRHSRVRQIASGRFGVTLEYLVGAEELQIKIAQGAKPGEGGQLPAHKVTAGIARIRHSTPGVTLVSPPPHHDIYSIEDLAQLIYDLKRVNPAARVSVKLVAEAGIGTIATGVVKAGADIIVISGSDGGTGASPLTAIRHVGLPWELGLAETQNALVEGGLRQKVALQVDGQLKTGRDIIVAALLGADEFAFGTSLLVALGCSMLRRCHLDTCPFGVATQDPALRARFAGKPEHIERFLHLLAEDARRWMASLGVRGIDELVGRVELLEAVGRTGTARGKASGLDLSALSRAPKAPLIERRHDAAAAEAWNRQKDSSLEQGLLAVAERVLGEGVPACYTGPVRNVDRAVGARLSGELARRGAKLPPGSLNINLEGTAGQSLGAFLAEGITLRVEGEANDYAGKGLSGGTLIVRPPMAAPFAPGEQVIVGNVALYGAISGDAYFYGRAGERFGVRNSGAKAVVEGVGDHCCEYMTGGVVVVLGATGYNFAAGMSGGTAYVYDVDDCFPPRCNMDSVDLESVSAPEDEEELRALLTRHVELTGSRKAAAILETWESSLPLFIKIMPIEYQRALERRKMSEQRGMETVSATEEVFTAMERKTA